MEPPTAPYAAAVCVGAAVDQAAPEKGKNMPMNKPHPENPNLAELVEMVKELAESLMKLADIVTETNQLGAQLAQRVSQKGLAIKDLQERVKRLEDESDQ
jgi:hypothetical protein